MSEVESKQELVQEMDTLRVKRDAMVDELETLANIPEHPPTFISLFSLGLVGLGIYFSVKVQRPELFDTTVLMATAMVLVGAGCFYYFKFKVDKNLNRRKNIKDKIDVLNMDLKRLSQETGVAFPKMRKVNIVESNKKR